jgi:putative chitinase
LIRAKRIEPAGASASQSIDLTALADCRRLFHWSISMSQSSFDEALSRLWPRGDAKIPRLRAGIIASAPMVFAKYGITTPLLAAHVMAQISHECGAGHDVVENLNYTAGRMMQVWPSRFSTMAMAAPYAGNPRSLANKVYNGRMGNAVGSDDGWNFRGRGASQTTGREGYARLAKATGLDLVNHPDLVNDPQRFLECGVADFVLCGCLPFARADDVLGVTRRLNGGTVGLAQRQLWLAKWKAALGTGPVVFAPAPASARKPVPVSPPPSSGTSQSIFARFIAALIAAFRRK